MTSVFLKIFNFFKENKIIFFIFAVSTCFYIYQHSLGIHWDFSSYSLNAQYLFANGSYFEWYRAPLTSFLIGIFTFFIFPFWFAEYIYIIFVSSIFLFSCIKFAENFKFDITLFYALISNPVLILTGVCIGTELLTLSFLLLFISCLFSDKSLHKIPCGFSYALACLTRYSCFPYLILIFLSKNIKKNIFYLSLLILAIILTFSPWFLFNFYETEHILTSISNSQALNIKYRWDYLVQEPSMMHFLVIGNLLIPFFIIGLIKSKFNRKNFAILLVLIITVFSYLITPVKECRYLFNLFLPLAYFSYLSVKKIKNSKIFFSFLSLIPILFLLSLNIFGFSIDYLNPPKKEFYDLNLSYNCTLASNQWVPLNYLGYHSKHAPREPEINEYIDKGYKIVIYYGPEPDYSTNLSFLKEFPIIEETNYYIILGDADKCREINKIDSSYLENLNKTIFKLHNHFIETNPCKSLGLGKICDYFKFL